jgi:Carboxypeptidase regulatory-like domain
MAAILDTIDFSDRRLGVLTTMRRMLLLMYALLFCCCCVGASPADGDTYTLRGTVVNSEDGNPIRTALVQLKMGKTRTVLTGVDGTFEFAGLAAGEAVVSVRKPGYFSPQELHPESVGELKVHVRDGVDAVSLRLIPEGIIAGRVVGEGGDPVEGLAVQLRPVKMSLDKVAGPSALPETRTNELGEYRMAEIKPGSYYVILLPLHSNDDGNVFWAKRKLPRGYPTYFYPGVRDFASATPLRVSPGRQSHVDWRVERVPYYQISGQVRALENSTVVMVYLNAPQSGTSVAVVAANPATGNFLIGGVPSGDYVLNAFSAKGGNGMSVESAAAAISVKENVTGVNIVLSASTPAPVRLKTEFTHEVSDSGGQEITPEGFYFARLDGPPGVFWQIAIVRKEPRKGEVSYAVELGPGTYRFQIPTIENAYVASATCGERNLLKEDLVVAQGGSAEPIELVVRDDVASVEGVAVLEGKQAQGRALLVPEGASRGTTSTAVDSDGKFNMKGLAPGRYSIVVLDGADDVELENAADVEKIQRLGESIELAPDATASVTLELKRWKE